MFILKGFQSRGFVPVNFPQDICMFRMGRKIFAVGLSFGKVNDGSAEAQKKSVSDLSIFVREDGNFRQVYGYKSKFLTKIDCVTTKEAGYVAVVNTIDESDVEEPENLLQIGSFVLRVTLQPTGEPLVETFQKFAIPNQNNVRLWSRSDNVYLVYSYNTFPTSPLTVCTIFKLAGTHFNPMDDLPCQNARVIEFFTVHHDLMVLVGNHRENNGTTNTFSSVMRYDLNQQRFIEHQMISTNAIAVGRYFHLDHQEQRQHFLFIGNEFEVNEFGVINYDVPSMIYKLVNGFFIPMQTVNVRHVTDVLPIIVRSDGTLLKLFFIFFFAFFLQGKNNEFHLLIASEDREVQIYFYDGWKFHESPIDFTGDAFGTGVVSLRGYDGIINGTTTIGELSAQPSPVQCFNWFFFSSLQSRRVRADVERLHADLRQEERLVEAQVEHHQMVLRRFRSVGRFRCRRGRGNSQIVAGAVGRVERPRELHGKSFHLQLDRREHQREAAQGQESVVQRGNRRACRVAVPSPVASRN